MYRSLFSFDGLFRKAIFKTRIWQIRRTWWTRQIGRTRWIRRIWRIRWIQRIWRIRILIRIKIALAIFKAWVIIIVIIW